MNYSFNDCWVSLEKGNKAKNDYIIKYSGITQFSDKLHFEKILSNFNSLEKFFKFIKAILDSKFLNFYPDYIASPMSGLKDKIRIRELHQEIMELNFTDLQKMLIFSSILRIDIDNISYTPPRLNGGVRHFIQLILLGGLHFNHEYYTSKLGFNLKYKNPLDKFVSDIGFPGNSYRISTQNFKNYYVNFYKQNF